MDGSPVVTNDSCLLIAVEKQYIKGRGGVFKLNPSKEVENCVEWYFPTENFDYFGWKGGIIGSVGVNDYYESDRTKNIAAFVAIDGFMYVVKHNSIRQDTLVDGPRLENEYKTPELIFKAETGQSISTPIIVNNKLIAATYEGIYLYQYSPDFEFKQLAYLDLGEIEATPIAINGCVYIASRNGNLYCLGNRKYRD